MRDLSLNELGEINGGIQVPQEYWGALLDAAKGMERSPLTSYAYKQYWSLWDSIYDAISEL